MFPFTSSCLLAALHHCQHALFYGYARLNLSSFPCPTTLEIQCGATLEKLLNLSISASPFLKDTQSELCCRENGRQYLRQL